MEEIRSTYVNGVLIELKNRSVIEVVSKGSKSEDSGLNREQRRKVAQRQRSNKNAQRRKFKQLVKDTKAKLQKLEDTQLLALKRKMDNGTGNDN